MKNILFSRSSAEKEAPLLKRTLKQFSRKTTQETPQKTGKNPSGIKAILKDLTSTRSILSKMVLVFLLLIIIPVATIGFIATSTASKNLLESAEDSVASATLQTSNYFDVFMTKAKDISLQIIADSFIQKYATIRQDTADPMDFLTAVRDADSALASINMSSLDINAKILFNSGTALGSLTPPGNMDTVFQADWYKKVDEAAGKPVWVDYRESMGNSASLNYALSLVRLYKSNVGGNTVGLVMVDISYRPISNFLASVKLGKGDATYLITNTGKVLSSKGADEVEALGDRKFVKEVIERSAQKDTDLFYTNDNGVEYLVSYHKSAETELTAVTVVPNASIVAGAEEIRRTTILTGSIFVLVAGAFGFIFSLGMTMALKKIMGIMSRAEGGDLTASLSMRRRDEFGMLTGNFNDMLKNIRNLVTESKHAAEEVVASSEKMAEISSQSARISNEIAHAIVEVASGSANQASEVDVSVKNVTELADKITLAVEKTRAMEADSESMKELSGYGLTTIESLNGKTAQTNEITANVVKEISQLNQYVKNINVITQVLRGIADQTNLLALNAAIEAARAGDAGKGFAVVADEIRKLAEQSNSHTREIQMHIENVFRQAQSSTQLVGKAEASIREQSEMVAQTAEAFRRINETTAAMAGNIQKVGGMINEMDSNKEMVLSSMENISAVSEEVSASTEEVSASTQQQLASVEQLDDMAKKLNELAADLIKQMEKFTV